MANLTSRSLRAGLVALAAACTTPEPDPADSAGTPDTLATPAETGTAEPASYKALGTEPFWALDISDDGLRFSTPENIDGVRFPPVEPASSGDTLTWRAETNGRVIEARIWPERCSDGMSDRTWTHVAALEVDTMAYRGCADPAPALARGSNPTGTWNIVGHRIPGTSALSDADAERMHGRVIVFDSARAVSDTMVCDDAAYRYETVKADSILAEFGTTPSAAGLDGTPDGFLGMTEVRCGDERWSAPGGLLLWEDDARPLTVWDGVFYELAARPAE